MDCVSTKVCMNHDELVAVVRSVMMGLGINTVPSLPPASSQSQSSLSAANANSSAPTDKTSDALVTQLMRDMVGALSTPIERPLASSLIINSVLTYYTHNSAPSEILDTASKRNNFVFDFMGTARLYLSPLNLNYDKALQMLPKAYHVDQIRVKVLGITFSKSMSQQQKVLPQQDPMFEENATNTTITQDPADAFVSLAGSTYTAAYRSAQSLSMSSEITAKDIGDAFVVQRQADATVCGVGLVTPKVTGIDTQWKGEYAAQYAGAKTEPIGTATEFVITDPVARPLALASTQAFDTTSTETQQANNTYSFAGQAPAVYTNNGTTAFQALQGSAAGTDLSAAVIPVYGMVQIDLPEDLIQEVYDKMTTDVCDISTTEETEVVNKQYLVEKHRYSVLNANYSILVEYSVSPVN